MGRRKLTQEEENIRLVMRTYKNLVKKGKVKVGGSAYKRLGELQLKWG